MKEGDVILTPVPQADANGKESTGSCLTRDAALLGSIGLRREHSTPPGSTGL